MWKKWCSMIEYVKLATTASNVPATFARNVTNHLQLLLRQTSFYRNRNWKYGLNSWDIIAQQVLEVKYNNRPFSGQHHAQNPATSTWCALDNANAGGTYSSQKYKKTKNKLHFHIQRPQKHTKRVLAWRANYFCEFLISCGLFISAILRYKNLR